MSQATVLNAMQEVSTYPGFVFRCQTDVTKFEFNSPKINNKTNINIATTNKITLKRINAIYYIQINDGNIEKLGTYNYNRTFDVPTVFGTSLDTNPRRYFKVLYQICK